ncbi:MAG: hypothetical protein FWC00_05065 [Firmicutes bacterium]|nr:hypothetical protein [Bacillota bacterium]
MYGRGIPTRVEHNDGENSTINYSDGYIFVNGIAGIIAEYKRKQYPKKTHHLTQGRINGSFAKAE